MVSWWGTDSYFNHEQIEIAYIGIMTDEYASSGYFDQEYGPNLLEIAQIQVEALISVQNQHQFMNQLTNQI